MFGNLIESGSHAKELKRKSSFMLGTTVIYTLLLLAAGVASVYAYDVHLDNQSLELITLVTPPEPSPLTEIRSSLPATSMRPMNNQTSVSSMVRTQTNIPPVDPTMTPDRISTARNNSTVAALNLPRGDSSNLDLTNRLPIGVPNVVSSNTSNSSGGSNGSSNGRTSVQPPPPMPSPDPPTPRTVSLGVINGRAISKPHPAYPAAARIMRAEGQVVVQIIVDEAGRVVSAHATSGHHLLRQTAVDAARRARFSPTLLSGQPVRVAGAITYNFILQ